MPNRFTLHGLFMSGPTYKVALMLSLCHEPFTYQHVSLKDGEHKGSTHMARNRFGQVPALEDAKTGLTLVQSAATLHYLAGQLGQFGGATLEEQVRALEWMFWDFDKLAVPIYRMRVIRRGIRSYVQPVAEMFHADALLALQTLEAELATRSWLAGQSPTIADIDVYGVMHYAGEGGFDIKAYPAISAWMQRFEALPGFATPAQLLPMP